MARAMLFTCMTATARYSAATRKYSKKHRRIIAKFDHYCYLLGNAVGEGNHGDFWRFLFVQV